MSRERILAEQARLLDALRRAAAGGRRFFAPEHADTLWIGRQAFYRTFGKVHSMPWFELGAMQSPVDYLAYAECILRKRPRVVVETGTASGAAALFYAEALKRVHRDDNVRVVTVERQPSQISTDLGACPNVRGVIGDSVDPGTVEEVRRLAAEVDGPVMVTLDSDHSAEHVAKEMGSYADVVSPGQYLVVQDTYLGLYWGGNLDHEAMKELFEGRGGRQFDYMGSPLGAVEALLSCDDRFVVDTHPQRWILTQCPFGFLLRQR